MVVGKDGAGDGNGVGVVAVHGIDVAVHGAHGDDHWHWFCCFLFFTAKRNKVIGYYSMIWLLVKIGAVDGNGFRYALDDGPLACFDVFCSGF